MQKTDIFPEDFFKLEYLDDSMKTVIEGIFIPITFDAVKNSKAEEKVIDNFKSRVINVMLDQLNLQTPINPVTLKNIIEQYSLYTVGFMLANYKNDNVLEKAELYQERIEDTIQTIKSYYNL